MERSVLLYHLYIINNWYSITKKLLTNAPHKEIVININYDLRHVFKLPFIWLWLKLNFPRTSKVFFTQNHSGKGEVLGFVKFIRYIELICYEIDILTYIHSKGVSKPNNKPVADWVELMRYFILERWDLTRAAFKEGYKLYGCNLAGNPGIDDYAFKYAPFIFRGNFVNVNYPLLKDKIHQTKPGSDYFGVEGYWGNLCDISECYCCHESHISHYKEEYPECKYKSNLSVN